MVTGLAKETIARGHTVEIFLPFYQFLEGCADVKDLQRVAEFAVPKVGRRGGGLRGGER